VLKQVAERRSERSAVEAVDGCQIKHLKIRESGTQEDQLTFS
jgi:hypothetical protein